MAELRGDERPTYILSYPRWIRLGRAGMIILLAAASVANWVLAWVRFVGPLVQAAGASTEIFDLVTAQPLRPLIAAHISLLLTAGAMASVFAFLPDLSLADDGLAVRTILGWRLVPWATIHIVRIVPFETSQRRLVLVQGRWSRWSLWPRLVSICLGAGFEPGLFYTSALRDFKPLTLRLYQEVRKASPETIFEDEFLSPSALLVAEPGPTLSTLVEEAREEGWPLSISAQVMTAVAGGMVVVQLLVILLRGDAWWKPLVIVGVCGVEWFIGAIYLYALTEIFPAQVELREAALLYPMPQMPRALLTVPMAMLIAAGTPFLAAMLALAGVLWAVTLTALMVQQLYRLPSILPAMIGGAFQALFQFLVLVTMFSS